MNLQLITIQIRYWPFQWLPYSCLIQAFYYYCCGYTSIVCLMAISVNRLIGITMPTYYEKGYGFYYHQNALTTALSSFNENR